MEVAVGGTLVTVGGTFVAVGGTLVAVGGTFVAVGGALVAVGGIAPEQTTPFTAKEAGTVAGLLPFVPRKPKATLPPLALMVPFQCPAGLTADMLEPEAVNWAFQPVEKACPGPKVQVRFQPLMAALPLLVMVISAWKPLSHWLTIL